MVRGRDKFTNGMGYAAVHLVNNDYWEKGKTVQGYWWGKACQRYGVEHGALVDTGKEFGALSSNKHAITGEQITKHLKERKPFCDITSGAPKTFSVGAVIGRTLGQEKADLIRGWHRSADEKQRIELEAITGRQANVKGGDHVELTCNVCAAVYEHDTNRCLEAHLHTHSVIQNMTQASNGKDYAIEFREYLDQSNYLTAIYRDSLAADALDHGVELQWDEHGAPQIVELLDMKEASEQRTREIESLVEQIEEVAGTKLSSGEAKVITLASRGLDLEKFKVIWAKEKDELDALKTLDPEKAIQSRWVQLTKFANIVTRSSQKDLFHITAKEVADKQLAIYTPEQQQKLCKWLSGIELVRRPDRSKEISQDVEFAIRHMFERKSVIKTHELYTEILNHARGQRVDLAHMKSMVAAHPELVQGRGGNVTTLTHLRREVESLLWIEEGKGKGIALEHRANDRLTAHQNEAVKSLLECQDQFSALSGAAGVGKTHSLAAVIEANLAAGRKVWIIATSDEAAKVLIKDAEKLPPGSAAAEVLRSAVNTQRFLTDPRLHNALGPGDLLISDESSMASTEQGHEIMKWARGHEARVLFAGDQDQLASVDAGDFFRIILDGSGIHTAHLSEILRQEKTALDGHYLKACQLFKLGKTTEAFYELDLAGRIFEIQGKSRVEAIADAIIRSQDEGVAAMAVNPTHRENDAISEAVRIRKHERGELADERTILAHRSLGWSEAQKAEIRRIQPGQILEIIRGKGKGKAWEVVSVDGDHGIAQDYNGARWTFNASNAAMFDVCERRELKVAIGDTLLIRAGAQGKNGSITNGERLTVVGWDAEGRPVSTDGRSIVIGNLSYAYASTVYKSQGSTTMRVIPGFDRESVRNSSAQVAYTACSRGVRDLWLFVENKADLALIEKHTGIRQAATEMEIDKAGPTFRSEAQKLFDQLEQLKARQTPEHPRQAKTLREHVVNLCQKVADAIGWNQKIGEHIPDNIMKVDLQELARKMSPEQHVAAEQSHLAIMKAAQRAEQHEQGRGMEI